MTSEATFRRQVAADPASIALLLTGRSGAELWPGVEAADAEGGGLRVVVDVPGRGRLSAAVRSAPPLRCSPRSAPALGAVPAARNPASFGLHFEVASAELPALDGTVIIEGGGGPVRGSSITLRLRYAGDRPEVLAALAAEFLANLTRVAAGRSRAA